MADLTGKIYTNPTGGESELSFHLDRDSGLEFVFSTGREKDLIEHTHMSTCTITLVRSGRARLSLESGAPVHLPGAAYAILPHQAHQPEYRGDYDLVSLCLKVEHLTALSPRQRRDVCVGSAAPLLETGRLSPEDMRRLMESLDKLPDYRTPPDYSPPVAAWLTNLRNTALEPDLPKSRPELSPFHFIRRFKREMGLTPHKYLMQYRLSLVKRLLGSDFSIAEAAQAAGFYDQSHLDRCFKKGVGISPSEYRRAVFSLGR